MEKWPWQVYDYAQPSSTQPMRIEGELHRVAEGGGMGAHIEIMDEERLNMAANILVMKPRHPLGGEKADERIGGARHRGHPDKGEELKKRNVGIHCMICPILREGRARCRCETP